MFVQENLLFVSETWMVNPRIGWDLGSFHHRIAHCLVLIQPHSYMTGWWAYPPLEAAVASASGLEEVETYILHRQNTIAQYIATRPILELCLAAEQRPGAWFARNWCYQAGLYPWIWMESVGATEATGGRGVRRKWGMRRKTKADRDT